MMVLKQLLGDMEQEKERLEQLLTSTKTRLEYYPTIADAVDRLANAIVAVRALPKVFGDDIAIEATADLTKQMVIDTHLVAFSPLTDGWVCTRCGRWRSDPEEFEGSDACIS